MTTNKSLNEQDILNDMLMQEKQMISSYSTYITEASCQNLRQVLMNNLNEDCQDQYQVFDNMKRKGYYQTKDASDNEVQDTKQKFQQMKNTLD